MDEPNEFLDQVCRASSMRDRARALEVARGVFYAMLRGPDRARCRDVAEHLPAELETVWKPAFFTCLRENRSDQGLPAAGDFEDRVRRHVPDLDAEEARRAARAVVEGLQPYLSTGDRDALQRLIPGELQAVWAEE